MCVLVGFYTFLCVFSSWGVLGRSWNAPGRSWNALGALLGRSWVLLGALGALLERSWCSLERSWNALGQKYSKKSRGLTFLKPNLEPQIHPSWLKNPLKIDVKKNIGFKAIFYFFYIFRELLAKARTLNFVAPVDVLRGFSKVCVQL